MHPYGDEVRPCGAHEEMKHGPSGRMKRSPAGNMKVSLRDDLIKNKMSDAYLLAVPQEPYFLEPAGLRFLSAKRTLKSAIQKSA